MFPMIFFAAAIVLFLVADAATEQGRRLITAGWAVMAFGWMVLLMEVL